MRHFLWQAVGLSLLLGGAVVGSAAGRTGHGTAAPARSQAGADISVELDVSTAHPLRGQRLTYVATMRNHGDESGEALELLVAAEFAPQDLQGRQSLPRLASVSLKQGRCTRPDLRQGFFFSCRLGSLPSGGKTLVRFVVVGDAPPSCASRGKASSGARSCKLTMAAAIRWRIGPRDNPQSATRSVRTVSFTPAGPPRPPGCYFATPARVPAARACYLLQLRASEDYVYTIRTDLAKELGCPGAPVIEARVSQRIEILTEQQPVKVMGNFPSLLTSSLGRLTGTGLLGLEGLLVPSRVTIVRQSSGTVLIGNPDREQACAGGPVPVKKLDNGDCGRRVLPRVAVVVGYDGPGRFKTSIDGTLRPYRHCELNDEAGAGQPVEWQTIYQSVATGTRRPSSALARRLFYGTPVGKTFSSRGGYDDPATAGFAPHRRGSVVLSFERLS
jgi:hypothetical protein